MVYLNENYKSKLNLIDTERAIKYIKDHFEEELANALNLTRVSAPLFVEKSTGLNDDLNGYERPVAFDILTLHENVEIVQSLAKWKRNALKMYGFNHGEGLYTDMNAIRRDEELDNLHSVYVDQWDWERIINNDERTIDFLKSIVNKIYDCLKVIDDEINDKFPCIEKKLVNKITFVSTTELETRYPDLARKERENTICKEYGSVFLYQIGWPLKDGKPHDGRACDYDDWNLNGDILVYNKVLNTAFELSSMGVRVNADSIAKQAEYKHEQKKLTTPYGINVLNNELPLTIGGGIGQSRLCMFFLEKLHIGEVQSSVWNEEDIETLKQHGIKLL